MIDDTPLPFDLPAVCRKKLTVDFDGGNQPPDAGLLLLREAERKLGACRLANGRSVPAHIYSVRQNNAGSHLNAGNPMS
jgi:hypothetical protein